MIVSSQVQRRAKALFASLIVAFGLSAAMAQSSQADSQYDCGILYAAANSNVYCAHSGITQVWVQSKSSTGADTFSSVCATTYSTSFARIHPYNCDNGGRSGYAYMFTGGDNGYATGLNNYGGAHYLQIWGWQL